MDAQFPPATACRCNSAPKVPVRSVGILGGMSDHGVVGSALLTASTWCEEPLAAGPPGSGTTRRTFPVVSARIADMVDG